MKAKGVLLASGRLGLLPGLIWAGTASSAFAEILSEGVQLVAYRGDNLPIDIGSAEQRVFWSARDPAGLLVDQGSEVVVNGKTQIHARTDRTGYFNIEVCRPSGVVVDRCQYIVMQSPLQKDPLLSPFGVMTHFAQGWEPSLLTLVSKVGILHTRDEAYWNDVEPVPGQYSWPTRYDRYLNDVHSLGVKQLLPLTFANKHYDGGDTPYTPAGLVAYAEYTKQVTRRYAASIDSVEIWNEYNGGFCKGPAAATKPDSYARMLAAVYPSLKADHPALTVVGGGTAGIPFPFFEKLFQAGGLRNLDVISIHPYRYTLPPEGIENEILALRKLIRQYNHGIDKPVWVTELGWQTVAASSSGDLVIDELDQARYLVRAFALLLSVGVERSYWYLLRDYDAFQNMGLIRGPGDRLGHYGPKPSLAAFAVANQLMSGVNLIGRDATDSEVYSIAFHRSGKEMRVMWALHPTPVEIHFAGTIEQVTMLGKESTLNSTNGTITLQLTESPIYITSTHLTIPPPLSKTSIVADSISEFSETQGANGWQYGVYERRAAGNYFVRMPTFRSTDFRSEWADAAPFAVLSAVTAHPGSLAGQPVPSVRRWVSQTSGPVQISGQLQRSSNQGHFLEVKILIDGQVLVYSHEFASRNLSLVTYLVQGVLKVGSTVDFVLESQNSADVSYDDMRFTASISRRG